MGPIKDNKLADYYSLIENDEKHKYVVDAEAPVYILEGLPGNNYSYDKNDVYKDYTFVI